MRRVVARTAAPRSAVGQRGSIAHSARLLPSLCTRGERRAAPTCALARRRGSYCCGAPAVGQRCAQTLALALDARVGGAPLRLNSCTSSRLVLLRPGGGARCAAPTYALAPRRGSHCCGASAVRQRGAQTLALALHAMVGGAWLQHRAPCELKPSQFPIVCVHLSFRPSPWPWPQRTAALVTKTARRVADPLRLHELGSKHAEVRVPAQAKFL